MDSRFHFTGSFRIYGKEFKADMCLNWSADAGEVDERITEWFLNCHNQAVSADLEAIADRDEKRLRDSELSELERLRAKYPENKG